MKRNMRAYLCSAAAAAAIVIGGMMLLPVEAQAKELTLKDYGNGFYLPESFDLRDSDGKILTSPTLEPSQWGAGR